MDLLQLIPGSRFIGEEIHAPCPFCGEGEDRFFVFSNSTRYFCRVCKATGDITEWVKNVHNIEISREDVETQTAAAIVPFSPISKELVALRKESCVNSYWNRFGWSDEFVDRMDLGYGLVYEGSSFTGSHDFRHLIPFVPYTVDGPIDGYAFEGRSLNPDQPKVKRNAGLKGNKWFTFWSQSPSPELWVTEGCKDALTALYLGKSNVMALFGTSAWNKEFSEWIVNNKFSRVVCCGDADDSGRSLNREVASDLAELGIRVYYVNYRDKTDGYDLSDLLRDYGKHNASSYLKQNTQLVASNRVGYLEDVSEQIDGYVPANKESALTVEQVSDGIGEELREFYSNYDKLRKGNGGRPLFLHLAAPTGSGKSYNIVEFVQEIARKKLEKIEGTGIEKVNTVLVVGPFVATWEDLKSQPNFDESLWYNLQPRSNDNCRDHTAVSKVAVKGYAASSYCKNVCPFLQQCKGDGYQSLMEEYQMKPITFARHAHLISQREIQKGYELIIIDESIVMGLSQPTVAYNVDDLKPVKASWTSVMEDDSVQTQFAVQALNDLLQGFRKLMTNSVKGIDLYGVDLYEALAQEVPSINSVADDIGNIAKVYQPHHIESKVYLRDELPHRIVPMLVEAFKEEYTKYVSGIEFNPVVHIINGRIELYMLNQLKIAKTKVVVVADATGNSKILETVLDRTPITYKPLIFNKNATITQLVGTDATKTVVGQAVRKYNKISAELPVDISGKIVEPEWFDFSNPTIDNIVSIMRHVAGKHKKVLFVSFKDLADIFRKEIEKSGGFDNVSVGHYGSLRGSNTYKDYDAVFMAGAWRVPYNAIYNIACGWARASNSEHIINNEITYKVKPYHGRIDGAGCVTINDPFADLFVDMIEEGELLQCMDRIRLYREGMKSAYLLMNRPAVNWVTDVCHYRTFINNSADTMEKYKDFTIAYVNERGKIPAITKFQKQFSITNHRAKVVQKEMEKWYNAYMRGNNASTISRGSD